MGKQATTGPGEKIIGWAILALLGAIAAGVIVAQRELNPANDSLKPFAGAEFPVPGRGVEPKGSLRIPSDEALVWLGGPERFGPETLSDKIDGKAELYLSAGLRSLLTQRVALKSSPEDWFEVFLYDMGTPRNAFAVFSLQRRDGAAFSPEDPLSYKTANARFGVRGRMYFEMIGSRPSETLSAAMGSLAEGIERENPAGSALESLPELGLFPEQDLDPKSLSLLLANAFGYEALDQVFIARYLLGSKEVTAFLSRRTGPEEAVDLARRYREFLIANGAKPIQHPSEVQEMQLVEILGTYVAVFSRGPFLSGVSEAPDEDSALRMAGSLYTALEKAL